METMEVVLQRLCLRMLEGDIILEPPCSEEEIRVLVENAQREFGIFLQDRYLDLLRTTDGLLENALAVFGSRERTSTAALMSGGHWLIRGVIEENREYRDNFDTYDQLFLYAYREGYVYAQVLSTGLFIKLSETQDEASMVYDTFEEMIVAAMQSALNE